MRDLCVFIPTYHRAEALERCLISIINECERLNRRDILICVSNNDKDDLATCEVVRNLRARYEIELKNNRYNIGIDRNMLKGFLLYKKASHILMLGDDDELCPGGMSAVLDATKKEYVWAILNWCSVSDDGKYYTNPWKEEELWGNCVKAFAEYNDKMPYGTLLVNSECIAKTIYDMEVTRYLDTYHLYSGVLWDMAELTGGGVLVIGKPIIYKHEQEKKSYDDFRDDVMLRAIPLWYDLLSPVYQEEAQAAKYLHLLQMYQQGGDAVKKQCEKRYPEIKELIGIIKGAEYGIGEGAPKT